MRPIRLLAPVAAILLGLLLAAAPATAAPAKTSKTYAFSVTSLELRTDWSDQSRGYPRRCANWTKGRGTVRQVATPHGGELEIDWLGGSWLGISDEVKTRGTFSRTLEYRGHLMPDAQPCSPCGPLSEYGECRPIVPDEVVSSRCGPRDESFEMHMGVDGPKLSMYAGMGSYELLPRCPEVDETIAYAGPTDVDLSPVAIRGGARKLLRLGVGGRRTLTFKAQEGRCAKLGRRGAHVCKRAKATVVFRRTS